MGGELEKASMQQKTSGKSSNRNHKNNLQSMTTEENVSPNKKASKSALKTTKTKNVNRRKILFAHIKN